MAEEQGMPIYYDDTEYTIINSLSSSTGPYHLSPANTAAQKLYRCIECMRDILEVLETVHHVTIEEKQNRRLKLLLTPLYSFVDCLIDLLHDIQTNRQTNAGNNETASLASQIEKRLKANIPFGSAQALRELRNKMSAHVDKEMHPVAAQKLFATAKRHEVGMWLHAALVVLADVLKLGIYQWACEGRFPNSVAFTSPSGPFLTVFALKENQLDHIAGVFLIKKDPRQEILDMLQKIVQQSQRMFRWNDPRIRGLEEGVPGTTWAKSLNILPKNGWKAHLEGNP